MATYEQLAMFRGNPVTFLDELLKLSRRPDRYQFGFDHEDLEWCAQVWSEAALCAGHDRAKDAFIHERDRCAYLAKQMREGMVARRELIAHVFLDEATDWPSPRTIKRARQVLLHAQIKSVH